MIVRVDHKMFLTPVMLIFRVYSLRSSEGKVLIDSLPPVRMTGQTQLHCIASGRRQLEKAGTKCKWPGQTEERHGNTWKIGAFTIHVTYYKHPFCFPPQIVEVNSRFHDNLAAG